MVTLYDVLPPSQVLHIAALISTGGKKGSLSASNSNTFTGEASYSYKRNYLVTYTS